jgi:hypothetical protein
LEYKYSTDLKSGFFARGISNEFFAWGKANLYYFTRG